jgi:hypothetical protein
MSIWDRVPWRPDSRQVQGRKTEKAVLKARGAFPHPMSGAGNIKHDGHDDTALFEVKDAKKAFTIRLHDVSELWHRAVEQELEPVLLIEFEDYEMECHVRRRQTGVSVHR